jgi:hypothetical protein
MYRYSIADAVVMVAVVACHAGVLAKVALSTLIT